MEVVGGAASEAEHQIFGRRRRRRRLGGGKHLRDRRIRHAREEREREREEREASERGRQPTERRAWRHQVRLKGCQILIVSQSQYDILARNIAMPHAFSMDGRKERE